MAGGNLSPRQKMINMMYLVLTALLALNVSAEILDAFKSLRDSLHESAESFAEKNKDTQGGIKAKITEELGQGNKKNEYLMAVTDAVEKEANGLVGKIEARIKVLEEISAVLNIQGDPFIEDVAIWPKSMPKYTMGHLERVKRVQQTVQSYPNLYLLGNAYGGVGIPDLVEKANELAKNILN